MLLLERCIMTDISAVDFIEFVLSFQYEVDKMKVFGVRPRSVKRSFVDHQRMQPQLMVHGINFDPIEVWVQVHGLRLDSVSDGR